MAAQQQMLLAQQIAAAGGSLSIIQAPAQTQVTATAIAQTTAFTAITSGNGLVVTVFVPTSGGTPAMSDSAGNTWPAAAHSYAGANGVTTWFYALANITNGPTWVRATFGGDVNGYIAPVEVAGAGSAISLDDSDGAAQGTTANWTYPFTSTVDDVLFVGSANLTNGSAPTGVSPVTAYGTDGDFNIYGVGIFPTAGSNTAQIDLAAGRNGDKYWAVFRAGS